MEFQSIEEVIEKTGINKKAAEVLGLSGSFNHLSNELNEIESALFARNCVDYIKKLESYEKRLEGIREREEKRKAKIEREKDEIEEKNRIAFEKYKDRVDKWEALVAERNRKNEEKEKEGKTLLKIPDPPKKPKLKDPSKNIKPLAIPDKPKSPIVPRETVSQRDRIKMERSLLRMYLSGHPLDEVSVGKDIMSIKRIKEIADEGGFGKKNKVIIQTVLLSFKTTTTRNDKIMARLRVEDKSGSIEVVTFSKVFSQIEDILEEGMIYRIYGNIDVVSNEGEDGTEQTHVQMIGQKLSIVRLKSDSEWDLRYPLLKGSLRIIPSNIQKSKGIAANIIKQQARK